MADWRPAFTLSLLGLVAVLAAMTWPIRSTSYLIPAFILVPTAALLVLQFLTDIRTRDAMQSAGGTTGLPGAFAWLALMPVLLAATGLVAGGAIYTFAYLRLRNGERRLLSLVTGLSVGLGLALLARALRMPQLFSGPFW